MDITPIETIYNGYRFRSRSEARWAVFFDEIGIKYEYEPEGFRLSDGTMYLPDFYLPESDSFFEVKGIMTKRDMHKVNKFVLDSRKAVTIGYSDMRFEACDFWADEDGNDIPWPPEAKSTSWLCECRTCGSKWFMSHTGSWKCRCCGEYDGDHHLKILLESEPALNKIYAYYEAESALQLAKQARFEHGETPYHR